MTGWTELIGWPEQFAAGTDFEGRPFLLYLRNRGCWQGWIVEGAVRVHDLAGKSAIWSEELLNGCHAANPSQAKLALVRIFKHGLGIKSRVKLVGPRLV